MRSGRLKLRSSAGHACLTASAASAALGTSTSASLTSFSGPSSTRTPPLAESVQPAGAVNVWPAPVVCGESVATSSGLGNEAIGGAVAAALTAPSVGGVLAAGGGALAQATSSAPARTNERSRLIYYS